MLRNAFKSIKGDFIIHKIICIFICILALLNLANAESIKVAKPSFDCTKAKSEVEKMICSDESGELQRLDRLYSKLYFTILKAIPKDTERGQKVRKNLKEFNRLVMDSRNSKHCPSITTREPICIHSNNPKNCPIDQFAYDKIDNVIGKCTKQIYLSAISALALYMVNDNDEDIKKLNDEYYNTRINEGNLIGNRFYVCEDCNIKNLLNYDLYNQFFEEKNKKLILEFVYFDNQRYSWAISGSYNTDDFNDDVKDYRKYYKKLEKAFKTDKKLKKLLGK